MWTCATALFNQVTITVRVSIHYHFMFDVLRKGSKKFSAKDRVWNANGIIEALVVWPGKTRKVFIKLLRFSLCSASGSRASAARDAAVLFFRTKNHSLLHIADAGRLLTLKSGIDSTDAQFGGCFQNAHGMLLLCEQISETIIFPAKDTNVVT